MTKEAQELLEQARALSPEDQRWLANELAPSTLTTPEWEQQWATEAERRWQRLQNGTSRAIPEDEFFRKVDERAG